MTMGDGPVTIAGVVLAAPWWIRPRTARKPSPAVADPDRCEGCQQCFQDCPYDAIRMVPGKYPDEHPLRAEVQADLCVSCGVCAASCASLAIGPPARTARDQLVAARDLVATAGDHARTTLVVVCRNNGAVEARLRGASELHLIGASERRLRGASERGLGGASEYRARGASEHRLMGASEERLRGASERRLGGASERR